MKSKLNSFALYLMSLAGMIGLYSVYAKFLVPLVEGPPSIVRHEFLPPKTELSSSLYDPDRIAQLFPQDAWENNEPKILVTEQGLVMFKEFARVEGGYLEVLPFTLVMNHRSDDPTNPSEPPTVLRCFKGARLKFDSPNQDPLAGKSKLESARLVGTVDIYRPSSEPDKADSIEILTSNVQIDKRQIHTIEEVQFAFGANRGQGRQLHIEFLHADGAVKPQSLETVNGIKRIELAFLRQLQIVPPNKTSAAMGATQLASASPTPNSNLGDSFTITCAGPFVLDMERRTATFNDRVNVSSQGDSASQIDCNRLTVFFNQKGTGVPGASKPENTAPPSAESQSGNLTWDMKRLVADGTPARFVSDSRSATVVGSVLSYDFGLEEIVVQRAESQPHAPPVRIAVPGLQIEANQIAYRLRADGGLGQAIAQGPGSLQREATDKDKAFLLKWERVLTIDPDGQQQLVSIDQNCEVRFDQSMQLKANQIKFWLNELQAPNVNQPPNGDDSKAQFSYQPDRLMAMQNVKISSPQLEGETGKLTAVWNPSDVPLQKQANFSPPANRVAAHTTNDPIQLVAFHQEVNEPVKKYVFKGETVDLKLLSDGDTSQLQDLTANGNVSLIERMEGWLDRERKPMTLTGHSLRCVPLANDNVRVFVTGIDQQFATIETEQLKLSGYQIHLDQAENKLWVDGAGGVQMVMQDENHQGADPKTGPPSNINGFQVVDTAQAKATQYKHVEITWSSGMIFNGRKVYFEDNVKMVADGVDDQGNPLSTQASGEGVTLELVQPIQFQKASSGSNQKADIREVIIVNQVATGQRVFNLAKQNLTRPLNPAGPIASIAHISMSADGQPAEQQRFLAAQITLDAKSGAVNSSGPGVLMHYRDERLSPSSDSHRDPRSTGSRSPEPRSRPSHGMNPFGPTTGPAAEGITFVRVNFDGTASANTNEKRLLIRGNVRTLYATVQSFDQVLDPDAQSLPPDAVKVKCDRLEYAQWTPRNSSEPVQELVAAGNAHVTSDTFEVTGDQVRYNQANDTMVIEGTGRSSAQLWYFPTASSKTRTHLTSQKMIYRLRSRSAEMQAIEKLDIQGR